VIICCCVQLMTCLCVLVFTLVLNAPVLLSRLLHALTVTTDADPPVFSAYLGQLWSTTQYKLELSGMCTLCRF